MLVLCRHDSSATRKHATCTSSPSVVIVARELLGTPQARRVFEQTLERVRRWYGLSRHRLRGYARACASAHRRTGTQHAGGVAIQMLKQIVAQELTPTRPPTPDRHTQTFLAAALLRLQCLDGEEAQREAVLSASQSREAWTRGEAGRLGVEQLSSLPHRCRRHGRNRVGVDWAAGESAWDWRPE